MYLFRRQNKFYYLQYFDQLENRLKRVSTKTKSKKEALLFLKAFESQLKTKVKTKHITLKQFKAEYIATYKDVHSKKYIGIVEFCFDKLIRKIGDRPIRDINTSTIEKFISEIYKDAPHSASLNFRTLRTAFNKAIDWNYLSSTPFSNLRPPKIAKKEPDFLTPEQLQTVLNQTDKRDLKDIYSIAFYTAMRLSELINLTWKEIDLDSRLINLQNKENFTIKNKEPRLIPVNEIVFNILKSRLPKVIEINVNRYIFEKIRGVKYNPDYVSKQFKKAIRETGLNESIHFHSLRHGGISYMLSRGLDVKTVQKIAGHSSLELVNRYSHVKTESIKRAAAML